MGWFRCHFFQSNQFELCPFERFYVSLVSPFRSVLSCSLATHLELGLRRLYLHITNIIACLRYRITLSGHLVDVWHTVFVSSDTSYIPFSPLYSRSPSPGIGNRVKKRTADRHQIAIRFDGGDGSTLRHSSAEVQSKIWIVSTKW